MADPIKFIFSIITTSDLFDVVGYLPFDGAEFCAHRHLQDPGLWNVAHSRTGLKLPIESKGSLHDALALAEQLSQNCPSAALITWDGENDGVHGKAVGPVKDLASEVKAVLAA